MNRPTIFIASSTEGVRVAKAIEKNLADEFECMLWKHAFASGYGNLESLVGMAKEYDYAAVLLSADDIQTSRGATQPTARDNLWFELGLFTGAIGRERAFFIYCKDDGLKIPSDFSGVTICGYRKHNKTGSIQAEVSPVCTEIEERAKTLGARVVVPRYLNTHYEKDLKILDKKWKPELIATLKTVIVLTGDSHVSDLLDREAAAVLRNEIDAQGASDPFKRAIMMNYTSWLRTPELEKNPIITIGGDEKAILLKKQIVDDRQTLAGHPPFSAGADGLAAYVLKPGFCPRVAIWGGSALATRNAVVHWIHDGRGLKEFLATCWK